MPKILNDTDLNKLLANDITPIRDIPNLKDKNIKGWIKFDLNKIKNDLPYNTKIYEADNKKHGAFFVDSSGFGADDERAMTVTQFIKSILKLYTITKNIGLAIVEVGQFQVKIGVFVKQNREVA